MKSESVPAYMNVGKNFVWLAEAGGRRTKSEPISEEEKKEKWNWRKWMVDWLRKQTKNDLHNGAIAANGTIVRAK